MEKDLILTKEDVLKLNIILTKIVDKSRIECAILINRSGRMVASQSEGVDLDKTALAALLSSTFSSTDTIAGLIGEKTVNSLVQEGKNRHIYTAMIDDNTVLSCIFDKRSTYEKVKGCISEYLVNLTEALNTLYNNTISSPEINLNIGEKSNTAAAFELDL